MKIWSGLKQKCLLPQKTIHGDVFSPISLRWDFSPIHKLTLCGQQTNWQTWPTVWYRLCEAATHALSINIPPTERETTVHKSFPVTHVYLSVRPSLPLADQRSIRWKVRVHSRALRLAPSPAAAVAKQSTDMFSMRKFYLHFRHRSC